MKLMRMLRLGAVGLAMFGMLAPQIAVAGSGSAPSGIPRTTPGMPVVDVTLQEGGVLLGQVVDVQGTPQADTPVSVGRQGQIAGSARTDAEGRFAIAGLGSGVYQLETTEGSGLCRLWTRQAAPPAAHDGVLLVSGPEVVRGKSHHDPTGRTRRMLVVGGIAAAAGVIGGVIGYNIRSAPDAS
jgi:hypothetical protein